MRLWEKLFYREIFKVFFFFLFSFFSFYALMDYSTHMDDFFKNNTFQIKDLFVYYGSHFLKRSDFLIPLALLIATIKILTTLNTRREWIVLQVSGLKTRHLLRPFFAVALLACCFNFFNFQFFLPKALCSIDDFHAEHFKHSHRAKRRELIHLLSLNDNSKLIYQAYDPAKDALFDVLWIRSPDDIWRMKYLNANPEVPNAQFVDHLIRNREGFLEKAESFEIHRLTDLHWHPSMMGQSIIPFENRSLKELFHLIFFSKTTSSYEIPRISTQFFFKCAIPFISFIIILAVAPYCLVFSRHLNLFFIYAFSLFGLLACYMLFDSMVTLGEHSVISPFIAAFAPLVILGSFFTWRFFKLT
jgi:lipopolysaccharide export system permease protein